MDKVVIDVLKRKINQHSSVLEIGFGSGRILFDMLWFVNPERIVGLELASKLEIENSVSLFSDWGKEQDKRVSEIKKDGRIDIFSYYQYYTQQFLGVYPFDQNVFNEKVKLNFETTLDQYLQTANSQFDLIILFNVLHYSDVGDPIDFLQKVNSILAKNGLLLIGFKNYRHSNEEKTRQHVNIDNVVTFLRPNFTELHFEDAETENSIIYLGQSAL